MLSFRAFSQSLNDSSYFYQQAVNSLNTYQANNNFLINNNLNRLGSAKLFYQHNEGGYKPVQQAHRTTLAGVFTEGINKFGRFASSGYFGFTRTWQDSLSWSTKGLEEDDQPYYYGSIKAGNFERIKYQLGGNLAYNLIKDKLYIGGGTKFLYNSSTRSVDPRPEVNTFNITVTPELIYRIKSQYFSIKAKWGYGTEISTISFKNIDYKLSTNGYPDRVNYLIMGYGLYKNNQGVAEPLRRMDKHYGLGFNYSASINKKVKTKAYFDYEHIQKDFYQTLDNSVNRAYTGFYDTDLLRFFLQTDYQSGHINHQFLMNYSNQLSNDINAIFYAINYRYKQNLAQVKYLVHFNKTKKLSPEFGVNAVYKQVAKTDYSTAHYVDYTWLEPTVSAGVYYIPNKANKFYAGLGIAYRKSLEGSLSVGANQQNLFTYWIAYPDYSYHTSSAYKIGGELKYVTSNVLNQFKTGLSVKADYYQKDKIHAFFQTAKTNIGNNLLRVDLSLNLYF